MNKTDAQSASLKLNREILSLNPSTIISLYSIDLTDLLLENGIKNTSGSIVENIFRFHSQSKLSDLMVSNSIWFQSNEFIASPIRIEGIEQNAKGTLPRPKLSILVDSSQVSLLSALKQRIFELGDLTGAKVIRQRTFAKFIDGRNFSEPQLNFEPDPNVEFPRDIFYIDRKSVENKYILEYELSSNFDIEGIKLPNRIVAANKCMFQYRGEGCSFEYNKYRTTLHGTASLPDEAPPLFNSNNEKISEIIGKEISSQLIKGEWNANTFYQKGDCVYIERNRLKYWFVCKNDNPLLGPPNLNYWVSDNCSKDTKGCKNRWDYLRSHNISSPFGPNTYPFGGFPGTRKLQLGD